MTLTLLALALQPTLAVGDPAPSLQVKSWVRGQPVTKFERGTVYLVEFWAPWCPPCVSAMLHLKDLYEQYRGKGLQVVALTQLDKWGGTQQNIRAVVSKASLPFSVGIDSLAPKAYQGVFNGKTECAYLGAAKVPGIPSTWVIDRSGRVAYIGLPTLVDQTLAQVMNGSFDREKASRAYRISQRAGAMLDLFSEHLKKGRYAEARTLGHQIFETGDARNQWLVAALLLGAQPVHHDLSLMLECSEAAVKASGGKDAGMLATLAGVYHLLGRREPCRRTLTQALDRSRGQQHEEIARLATQYGL